MADSETSLPTGPEAVSALFDDGGAAPPRPSPLALLRDLDPGGVAMDIAARALLAGWLAFLFRMYCRRPFPNIMFFCVVMFTVFAIQIGGSSRWGAVVAGFKLYAATALGFFMIAALSRFPSLKLLFIFGFSFVMMAFCRQRVMAVLPVAYTFLQCNSPATWHIGVDNAIALGCGFLCTIAAAAVFPGYRRAAVKICVIRYIRGLRGIFSRLMNGDDPGGADLAVHLREQSGLAVRVLRLNGGDRFSDQGRTDFHSRAMRRFHLLRDVSRGLFTLRGFGAVRGRLKQDFPRLDEFTADFSAALTQLERGIVSSRGYGVYKGGGGAPPAGKFLAWRSYFADHPRLPGRLELHRYALAALSSDIARALDDQEPVGEIRIFKPLEAFFSRRFRLWEALRLSLAAAISFIIFESTRMPYGEWIGMIACLIYVVPQHGLVFQRINHALAGTSIGVCLGFIMAETMLRYCWLWIYALPVLGLILMFIFALKQNFGVMMMGFTWALMLSLILQCPENNDLNLYQALASRMAAIVIAALVVACLELFAFRLGSVTRDVMASVRGIFHEMEEALRHCSAVAVGSEPDSPLLEGAVSEIIACQSGVRLLCEALEFEIGYNPALRRKYDTLLRHLWSCGLYLRRMIFLARHRDENLDAERLALISKATGILAAVLRDTGSGSAPPRTGMAAELREMLLHDGQEPSSPAFTLYAESLTAFAWHLEELRRLSSVITAKSALFAQPQPRGAG